MSGQMCPCSSGSSYEACCKPFHEGKRPSSALELMRSRYSAYAFNKPEYIIATTHPLSPQYNENKVSWKNQLSHFSRYFTFNKLEILDFKEQGNAASVVFVAHITHEGEDHTFTERSLFEKVKDRWFYKVGVTAEGHALHLVIPGPLRVLPMAYYGDPVLRKKGEPINEINEEVVKLVEDMIATMDAYNGIGLAAPQIHKSLRLFMIRKPYYENEKMQFGEVQVFINPILSLPSEENWKAGEGCLSIPTVRGEIERPNEITVEYTKLNGERVKERFSEYHAKMIMHENDHIQGVLFIDRIKGAEKTQVELLLKNLKKRISSL